MSLLAGPSIIIRMIDKSSLCVQVTLSSNRTLSLSLHVPLLTGLGHLWSLPLESSLSRAQTNTWRLLSGWEQRNSQADFYVSFDEAKKEV